jgi:hypothetical protein
VRELESSKIPKSSATDPSPNVAYEINNAPGKPFVAYQIEKLREGLSDNHKEITDLMANMLSFNPYFRMTAYECLKHKIFDAVR